MSATSRRSGGSSLDPGTIVLWTVLVLVVVAVGAVTLAVHLGNRLAGSTQQLPANPFELVFSLAGGTLTWPGPASWVLAGLGAAVLLLAAAATAVVLRVRRRRSRVDRAARHLGRGTGTGGDLHALGQRGAAASAARLGVQGKVGLPIAATVAGGQTLYSSWEDVSVDIWGPRTGKTTSRAIPAILNAPGAVLATSNKRDLVDATRGLRASAGPVWVFDPQGIVDEPASWWWNPLSYVTDEVKASMLADVFASAARDPGARTDAYFDAVAQGLLAGLLLAAALGARPIRQVYLWLTDPTDDEPVVILRAHGVPLSAAAVAGVVNAPEKQRGGVYGTAQQIASFLTNRQAVRWVTPPDLGDGRRQFDPAAFVAGGGTLYSLSKEGRGSAGPLVTALTVAVTEAAEQLAKRSPGGRLPVPLVAVLDEAANVCRWRELPNQYSHYGSRGIVVLTILQSWSQGVEVWGREGMRKLWSAANVKVYGGGVSEVEFLSELSQLIGDYDLNATSTSQGKGGRSISHSTRRERVLDVADLAALPKGRAVVIASGAPATLARTLPWMTGPHAAAVKASIRAHDPASEATLTEATRSAGAGDAHPAGAGR
jgi:type IV secretory pathway TraG/TraD family ATPase VirD4